MTDIQITPESLRAHALLLEEKDFFGAAGLFLSEADRIEREQAEEKRIDECVAAYVKALADFSGLKVSPVTPALRAGILAVLAKLDEEKADPDAGGPNDHSTFARPPLYAGPWASLLEVPADVHAVYDRVGDRYVRINGAEGWGWGNGLPLAHPSVECDIHGPFEIMEPKA